MSKSGYTITSEGEVALAAAGTIKTILGINAGTEFGVDLHGFWVDFDGVSATDKPVKVILGQTTFATNAPGTSSTTVTVRQKYGRLAGTGFAGAKNWTAEPTVITSFDEFALDVNKGLFRYDWPLGETPDFSLGDGFTIQALIETSDTAVGAIRAGMRFERC